MHIAINAGSLGADLAGNTTFITSTIKALAEIDQKNQYTIYVNKPEAIERYANRWANFTFCRPKPHIPFIKILIALNSKRFSNPVDVLFVQFTAPPFLPCKLVAMIPDISYEHFPETFTRSRYLRMKFIIKQTAKNAAHVITPSEYSRQDLIKTYNLPPEKISMIPHAAPTFFKPVLDIEEIKRIREKYNLQGDFILGVGSIQPRKNLVRLIEAYSMLVKKRDDVPPLVLVGKKAWLFEDIIKSTNALGVEHRVIFTGFVPDEDLPPLYTAAKCFVYPSFFEGFGLPPLEAMQCGTPVITGNLTSLPEVVGNAGLLVDPYDTNAIADALERMIKDDKLREDLSKKGLERAKEFSWIEAARQTLDIFEMVGRSEKRQLN